MEAAGYSPGTHPLRLLYMTTPEGRRLAEVLQAMLHPVGIEIEIHTNEWATFYSDLRNGNFDVASSQWVGIGDPHQYYEIFDSHMTPGAGGENRGDYSNPRMDQLVEAGDATTSSLPHAARFTPTYSGWPLTTCPTCHSGGTTTLPRLTVASSVSKRSPTAA